MLPIAYIWPYPAQKPLFDNLATRTLGLVRFGRKSDVGCLNTRICEDINDTTWVGGSFLGSLRTRFSSRCRSVLGSHARKPVRKLCSEHWAHWLSSDIPHVQLFGLLYYSC